MKNMGAKVHGHYPPVGKFSGPRTKISSLVRVAPVTVELEPAVIGAIFLFASAKQFERARGLRMRASDQNRSQQAQRSHVRSAEGGTGDGSNRAVVANAGDRRCFTVGDAKRRPTELFGAQRRCHCVAQALPEPDRDR